MTTQVPSPIKIDDLKAMTMSEVFKLVKDIESVCKVHADNMRTIHQFIKDKMPV